MKKNLLLSFLLVFSMAFVAPAFSQTDTSQSTTTETTAGTTGTSGTVTSGDVATPTATAETPGTTVSETDPVVKFFGSITGILLLSMIVTGWLTSRSTSMSGTLKQIISWIVPVGICLFGSSMHYGIFESISLPLSAGIGALIAAVANGLWDAGTLDNILGLLGVKVG